MKIILLLASIYALIINQSRKSAPADYSAKEEKISAAYIGKIASRFEQQSVNDFRYAITMERKDPAE